MAQPLLAPPLPPTLERVLDQLLARALPGELVALEEALAGEQWQETFRTTLRRRSWWNLVAAMAQEGARAIPGVSVLLLSPDGKDVIFAGEARTVELADQCNALLQRIQEELAPGGEPVFTGGFFDRGLDAFAGYRRFDVTK